MAARSYPPHLERFVTRSRHDIVSCRANRTPSHRTRMSTQRANQCRVWQVLQQVPACQVWARNVRLECLAQVREFWQVHEAAREDSSKVVIAATAVEQVAHVGEVAL